MARNPVQFQKGISLNEFLSLYGTEEQCFDALYRWRWPNGFVCPNCGHDRGCQLTTHKLQQCYRCNRQTSITAGTIFEATKLPLTVWLQGIYFMTQDKKGVSAMKLHRQLGISYNAAWRMRHKLMQVMMERDREHPLGGFIQLDDAYLGGERSGGKRGRGAPGKTPFVAAVETNAEGHPLRVKLTVVEGFRLTEIAAWAQQHLSPGTQVLSDGLSLFGRIPGAPTRFSATSRRRCPPPPPSSLFLAGSTSFQFVLLFIPVPLSYEGDSAVERPVCGRVLPVLPAVLVLGARDIGAENCTFVRSGSSIGHASVQMMAHWRSNWERLESPTLGSIISCRLGCSGGSRAPTVMFGGGAGTSRTRWYARVRPIRFFVNAT